MNVTLKYASPLEHVKNGIRMCWNSQDKSDDMGDKDLALIDRVCNKFQHSSMLRFYNLIYEVELSTSALLEWTRHQIGVDYAVKSTRYTFKRDGNDLQIEFSKNSKVNALLAKHLVEIQNLIQDNPGISNDDLKLLAPQAYIYTMQVQFNLQSLQHFLALRTNKTSHYHIRELAYALYDNAPDEVKYLLKDYVYKKEDTDDTE
jgi:thymidylate synthase (FAD)